MSRSRAGRLLAAALLPVMALTGVTPTPAQAATTTVVTVDGGSDLGALNNPADYLNAAKLGPNALAKLDEIGPKVSRVWIKPEWYYNTGTGAYTWNDATTDEVKTYSDRTLINLGQCDSSLMTLEDPAECRAVLKAGLKHHKLRHPEVQYVEFFNEPDKTWPVQKGEDGHYDVDVYYQWYRIGYSIINELNAELYPVVPLRIGGPAMYRFDGTYLKRFLALYAADTDTTKRLDFISYHEYHNAATPAKVKKQKQDVQSWLGTAGVTTTTPVFVTEYGVFPGSNTASDLATDRLTQAAAVATLGMHYVEGGMDMPMHWSTSLGDTSRKSMLAIGPAEAGDPDTEEPEGTPYPYYNVVKMQSMLKTRRISSTSSGVTTDGIGVNALATRDDTGIAVLATNYQWSTGTAGHDVTLAVNNRPASFTGRQIRVQRYLVDATTSNVHADPAKAGLAQVEDYVLAPGGTPKTFTLTPNAVTLVVLTPVTHAEAEALTPATLGGNADLVDAPDASAGRLRVFQPSAAGHHVTYTLTVPQSGPYRIVPRLRYGPTRGVAQASVNGVAIGAPIDLSAAGEGFGFKELDLGTRFLTAGTATITFTMTAAGTAGGYSFGVDSLTLLPAPSFQIEVEDRLPTSPTGNQVLLLTEGAIGYAAAGTTAVGQKVQYTFRAPYSGTFKMITGIKTFPTRGTCQYAVDDQNVGAPQDQYSTTITYLSKDVGVVTIGEAGWASVTCTITGKNSASTGYGHALNHLRFEPAQD
ncbi:hypothetical protein [Actinoplanes sp. NPDC049802]|uniref:hypothetical protein n=1 Tax=Actinoplanes sp. NPDC049802 TaxID=3154742 RepID=UPI0033DE39FA